MTYEQAKKLLQKVHVEPNCNECPYKSIDPQNSCTIDDCMTHHEVLGIQIGYNKALEDLKAPKTLAENRED